MADQIQTESQLIDVESIRGRIKELTSVLRNPNDASLESPPNYENLLQDCVQSLETQVKQIVSEHLDVGFLRDDNLDAYLARCKEELRTVEAESTKMHNEIELLKKAYVEGACQLEGDLEALDFALSNVRSQGVKEGKTGALVDGFGNVEAHRFPKEHQNQNFQVLDLNYQIESNMRTLKTMQDLELMLKRCEAIDKIEESFSGVKVIAFEGNCIRLSLKTCISCSDRLVHHQKFGEKFEPSELDHELLIELMNESMELKHVEIFPNDVYIGDIFEAATSASQVSVASLRTSSSLWWFLQKVQDKIILCTLRQFMVKTANKSRYSIEYSDREELITARIRGINAFIKTSEGWPLSTSLLKLTSLKPSDHDAEISLRLLYEIEERANSLDVDTRKSITSFVGAIEETLSQRLRKEVHS